MWTNPIYDRTQADINNKTAKAYYKASDLNRIERNCDYLAGIFGVTVNTKSWTRADFPTPADFSRILNNIAILRAAYHAYQATPPMPSAPLNEYHKANNLEQILNDLKALYDDNKRAVSYAGEVYAGQMIGVI